MAAVCLALIYQDRDTRKDWFQLKTLGQGSLLASVVPNEVVQKKLSKAQPKLSTAERCTLNWEGMGTLNSGHKPEAVKTGHLTPAFLQKFVLASFSPTELFHLPMALKTQREPDWSQQLVPSPLTPSVALLRSKAGGGFLYAVPAFTQVGKKIPTNKQKPAQILAAYYLSCQNISTGETGCLSLQQWGGHFYHLLTS